MCAQQIVREIMRIKDMQWGMNRNMKGARVRSALSYNLTSGIISYNVNGAQLVPVHGFKLATELSKSFWALVVPFLSVLFYLLNVFLF